MKTFRAALVLVAACLAAPAQAQVCACREYLAELINSAARSSQSLDNIDRSAAGLVLLFTQSDNSELAAASFDRTRRISESLGQRADQQPFNMALLGAVNRPSDVPFANGVSYSTLLDQPMFNPDPRGLPPATIRSNYVLNASSLNHPRSLDSRAFGGSPNDVNAYLAYVKTAMAAQSFSAYVLSNHATGDAAYGPVLQQLLADAADPGADAAIATEPLGAVLRQLLVVERQNLLLMSQLVQTTKQLLAAQAIANALAVKAGTPLEELLLERAAGRTSTEPRRP